MKTRFNSIDILASINELQNKLQGMRVQQVYDIDNKTYLIKLSKHETKAVMLLESGSRIHCTEFEWPKNPAPSSFSMKLRKHLKSRRFEKINMLGVDRIVDIQFGSSEAAYHVILELYDRGNICLTDHEYTILNLLRSRTDDNLDIKLAVREKYPIESVRQPEPLLSENKLLEIISAAKASEPLKKVLNPHLIYGSVLIEDVLSESFKDNIKVSDFDLEKDIPILRLALEKAENFITNYKENLVKGYIIQKKEVKSEGSTSSDLVIYQDFQPYLFKQYTNSSYIEFETFDKAVDEFFSKLEGQKLDVKFANKEKSALKKLDNVRKDHVKRVGDLQKVQEYDKVKAELIEMNLKLVDRAILIIRSALANQLDWTDIENIMQDAKSQNDPVASAMKKLKLDKNQFTMLLTDPYGNNEQASSLIDIDLDLSAYANARRYYDQKRHASKKEQKTMEASQKALKSAERKTKQTLKDVAVANTINKARKTYWFEKFLWFISSENYLVIGGRDQQQNEMIVKKYMRSGDAYVHADLHGASSIVIKNPSGAEIPPKTLNEAGTMAVCSSAAWEAKVVTIAWWVNSNQVSKTAPSGEFLSTGSFMIRGKKNYLPPCYLVMGFGFLFKLDEESLDKHKNERRVKTLDNEEQSKDMAAEINNLEEISLEDDANESNEDETDSQQKIDTESAGEDRKLSEARPLSESDDEESEFPDTQVTLQHVAGDQLQLKVDKCDADKPNDSKDRVVFLGDDKPVVFKAQKQNFKPKAEKCETYSNNDDESKDDNSDQNKIQGKSMKRRQKAKMKRMKNKYKDQDEEERELRMQILASAGKEKETKKKKDLRNEKKIKNQKKTSAAPAVILHEEAVEVDANDAKTQDDSDDEDVHKDEMLGILSSLTGCPYEDDCLLFAVPICAPYGTLQNYKYRVKLTPGTGKRGKAAKTAVQIFLKSKDITPREKDVLKSVKDQDISRNLPGKVKLSVAQSIIQKAR